MEDKASIVGPASQGGNAKFNTESQTYACANFFLNAFLLKKNKVVFWENIICRWIKGDIGIKNSSISRLKLKIDFKTGDARVMKSDNYIKEWPLAYQVNNNQNLHISILGSQSVA